jgi:hypothetical protein
MRKGRPEWLALLILAFSAFGVARAETGAPGAPILLYHRFHPSKPGSTTVTDPSFEAQLDWLEQHGYRIVTLGSLVADLLAGRKAGVRLPRLS